MATLAGSRISFSDYFLSTDNVPETEQGPEYIDADRQRPCSVPFPCQCNIRETDPFCAFIQQTCVKCLLCATFCSLPCVPPPNCVRLAAAIPTLHRTFVGTLGRKCLFFCLSARKKKKSFLMNTQINKHNNVTGWLGSY